MENWEIQEMVDNLAILEHEMKGTRDYDVIKKARNYINDLEKRIVEIAEDEDRAIKLLKENGYIVTKLTPRQLNDMKKCEECSCNDEEMECSYCSCSVCIAQ